ncbi:MAG TPA: uroporphyrinogen-III synthase [Mycobacteriales bacterium]|nr:uroporphyrinogen-III synthase [Mycobacteriales bacterium]
MEELPLAGFTVAVTAARRREELTNLLVRRGARVVEAPAIRIIPTQDDDELRAATEACITQPPDVVIATTGIGFRGWMEAADGWGIGEPLRAQFARSEVLVRGPKAKGAVRAHGLAEAWSPDSESTEEVLTHLLAQGVAGKRVALQLHGEPLPDVVAGLTRAGAEVVEIPVYRWVPAEDIKPVQRLVDQLVSAQVDCVTFTSAPAVSCLLDVATERGKRPALLRALGSDVLAACVGPVTASRLERLGIPTVQPERARLGALVRTVVEELPARRARTVHAGNHVMTLRGHSVLVDGEPVSLTTRQSAVLSAFLDVGPGRVLSRAELLNRAWRDEPADEHAVEMTVARLRSALGPAGKAIETVVKRGYRLASQTGLDDVREM